MTSAAAPFGRLAVVGFGLVGASIALAARKRSLVETVIAIDQPSATSGEAARAAADVRVNVADASAVQEHLRTAQMVVLAAPVGVIASTVASILEVASLVTDTGSTKRAVVRAADASPNRGRFVAGHPMAGGQRGGAENARDDLFQDRSWILCPEGSDTNSVERVEGFVRELGAVPRRLTAAAHDRAVALTSHVPQLIASALAVCASEREANDAAGPAFESATRVAGGGAAMWRDILETNADEVSKALDEVCAALDAARAGLRLSPPDTSAALDYLERARRVRRG